MPERIYNEVIVPFLSVVENPTQREDLYSLETKLIKEGRMEEADRYKWPNNKLIMLSSASYKFEYMYKLYSQFEELISSGSKGGAHRCIMQFSYDCAPTQLYDQNLIDQAKATMSQSQFEREFGAMFTDDSSGYFKTSRMAECSIRDGAGQTVEVKGEPGAKYLLAFDPSWAESESSDDFAMTVFKLNDTKRTGTMVHGYALPGTNLKQHLEYFDYILSNFNIVSIVGDYNGGVQFLNAANESNLFKTKKRKIKLLSASFDKQEEYSNDLMDTKKEYNVDDNTICFLRKPSSSWIRIANELLQANFDHKRISFGARALDDNYHAQIRKKIPIGKLKFLKTVDSESRQSDRAKMIDFVEHQYDMIELTKSECALIQIKTSPQGTQTFDLPDNLKRQTGPDKARKDSYSALVLGNWMIKIYYDMLDVNTENIQTTFTPMFIG
jgi:hypothetical protein